MDNGQIMSIIVSAVGLIGFYFAGKRVWWSWYINLFCQALWVTFALATGYLVFLATAAVYSVIFGINAWRWTKEHLMVKRMIAEGDAPESLLFKHPDTLTGKSTPVEIIKESNLIRHARAELNRIGEDPEVIDWYVRVINEYRSFGHSGGSHMAVLPVLTNLLDFKPLTPITNDPDEWHYHGPDMWDGKNGIWQNKRDSRMFSDDGGKTYRNVNENKEILYTSLEFVNADV